MQLCGTGKHDSIADLERRQGPWSMHRNFSLLQTLGLNDSLGSRNSDLERRRHACWYMGFLAKFDICEGSNPRRNCFS